MVSRHRWGNDDDTHCDDENMIMVLYDLDHERYHEHDDDKDRDAYIALLRYGLTDSMRMVWVGS